MVGRKRTPMLVVLGAGLLLAGCGEDDGSFLPPLLMDTAGLGDQVPLDPEPLALEELRQAAFPPEALFHGHVLPVAGPASLDVYLEAGQAAGVALYGPRRADGLFGAALAWDRTAGPGVQLTAVELTGSGDFLVLVADLRGSGGSYQVLASCPDGCGQPACPALVCGSYCATGMARDADGCPRCECEAGCDTDADCPPEHVCDSGVCRQSQVCQCQDHPYDPVCGADGITYANQCELDCTGVAAEHPGPCDTDCISDADCPAGMLCADGACTPACDCGGAGTDPVCGTDGLTYLNDCELRCAGVDLAHQGACDQCLPEICDGLDNDCDGIVDEGCPDCRSNSDCPAGQVCVAGLCVDECTPVPETCDGQDNDCDGTVDEDFDLQNDPDNCGWCGNACTAEELCIEGTCILASDVDADGDGYRAVEHGGNDCDDSDASVNPGAAEACDGIDNDCDGIVDQDCPRPCESDADCGAGEVCLDGLCVVPCRDDSDCPDGQTCNLDQLICVP